MNDYNFFKNRRKDVLEFLKEDFKDLHNGVVMLFADFENDRMVFRQDSSFYYLTGVEEPGAVFLMYLDGRQVLYVPNYDGRREKWTSVAMSPNVPDIAQTLGVTDVKYLGKPCPGFSISPVFKKDHYETLVADISDFLAQDNIGFFTLLDNLNPMYFMQVDVYKNMLELFPKIEDMTYDLAPLVHHMRRFKSEHEVNQMYTAVQITNLAHQAVSEEIQSGCVEYEMQAIIESIFTHYGAACAFPSIVAAGKNTTVLHYTKRDQELKDGDLVIVDIGAQYNYYAADLTRTYPVNGVFTDRQKEIYDAVLKTQSYVESIATPGMCIKNDKEQEKSLHHKALKFLKEKGLAEYMYHGIGHFLGLDVHDVGDYNMPLTPGDVFTIEPGVYIPQENLGVRIEDDYVMTDNGAICLSYQLPKTVEEIEKMMRK
jgi:Xaa-Pro aminopeptidase